ncbi:hypothetical protein FRB97_002907 [Tulasnella sp. 331]|nr:hypothetical protein FRB97_002907 [Tulasnella sp. 331]
MLLSAHHIRRLSNYLNSYDRALVLSTIKLFVAMSSFAGGREKKNVLDAFPWTMKPVAGFLDKRRKPKQGESVQVTLSRQDIRTAYISFILSFVDGTTSKAIKLAFLENKSIFLSIFTDIYQDSLQVLKRTLHIAWDGIWGDAALPLKVKVGLFMEKTLQDIARLYDRAEAEGPGEDAPADVAHHFLLAICSRPGTGICFKSRGWYPRQVNTLDISQDNKHSAKLYNTVLLHFITTLKANEDVRQQELVLKVLEACPELVSEYWEKGGLSLEPRLKSRWISNISIAAAIITLPVPAASFRISNGADFDLNPPPSERIVSSVIPSTLRSSHLTRGLKSASQLVRLLTANIIAKALQKYGAVIEAMDEAHTSLEEDDFSGAWVVGRRNVAALVALQVPAFATVVEMLQDSNRKRKQGSGNAGARAQDVEHEEELTQHPLLSETTTRLMWLYHRHLPDLVAESVQRVRLALAPLSNTRAAGPGDSRQPLGILNQLHSFRLLGELDHVSLSFKTGDNNQTVVYQMLRYQLTTPYEAVRQAGRVLLYRLLSRSILFEHDPSEAELWLSCLPSTRFHETSKGGADNIDAFLHFFEDCLLRCLKTPYKYLEESLGICSECEEATTITDVDASSRSGSSLLLYGPSTAPSPLLFTVLEQLRLKITGNHIDAADCCPVFRFLRQYLVRLMAKHPDMQYTRRVAQTIGNLVLVFAERTDEKDAFDAVVREARILRCALAFETEGWTGGNVVASTENLGNDVFAGAQADEIIKDLRSREVSLSATSIAALTEAIVHTSGAPSNMQEFLLQLVDPAFLWTSLSLDSPAGVLARNCVPFHWAYLRAGANELLRDENLAVLTDRFKSEAQQSSGAALNNMGTILLRLQDNILTSPPHESDIAKASLLILVKAIPALPMAIKLKSFLFQSPFVRHLCCSPDARYGGLLDVLFSVLSSHSSVDRQTVKAQCAFWENELTGATSQTNAIPFASSWLEFMEPEQILRCIDAVMGAIITPSDHAASQVAILERSLTTICSHHPHVAAPLLAPQLTRLLSLSQLTKGRKVLTTTVLTVLEQIFPYGHNARLPDGDLLLSDMCERVDQRWQTKKLSIPDITGELFDFIIQEDVLSTEATSIVVALVRLSLQARSHFAEWLQGTVLRRSLPLVLPALDAFLDMVSIGSIGQPERKVAPILYTMVANVSSLLKILFTAKATTLQREHSASCVSALVRLLPDQEGQLRQACREAISAAPHSAMLTWEAVSLFNNLGTENPAWRESESPVALAVESGLKWLVRRFAEDPKDSTELLRSLGQFELLVSNMEGIKAYIAEPVFTAAIQHRLDSFIVVQFTSALFKSVALKPVNINRLIQNIVQHSTFYASALDFSDNSPRSSIIDLLHALFLSHPTNTCQPSHVAPLIRIYLGTQSLPDRQLLSIFHLFELQRRISVASLISRWSASPGSTSNNSAEALTSLDASIASRTYTSFPQKRGIDVGNLAPYRGLRISHYDPVFVLTLMGTCLMDGSITAPHIWSEVGRTNAVSVAIMAMSSKDPGVRSLAITVLTGVWRGFQGTPLHERDHVLLVLNYLRRLLPSPSSSGSGSTTIPRFPTYVTLLLAHAMQCVFYPQNFLYPTVMRFLMQRPEMDIRDVPMLYTSLYSNSDDWKRERSWIVRFLADGMVSTADWTLFKRRHTWDLLATLFQESPHEPVLRQSILQVLLNVTAIEEAARSLVLKGGLLGWMEVQTEELLRGEELTWLKVYENLLVMVGLEKLEKSSAGLWKDSVSRSLITLLRRQGAIEHLSLFSRVLYRLSTIEVPAMSPLLDLAVGWLRVVEISLWSGANLAFLSSTPRVPVFSDPPHTGLSTSKADLPGRNRPDSLVWGEIIELLWQVCMTLPADRRTAGGAWNCLTPRLLIWNAMQRGIGTHGIGEWARQQVLESLIPAAI